mmetsp:Transcript_22331/g.27415  ORF Transcript_22331/g.27415 Transcript_22331/m.27415 type:complete len:82 (-) Transcript_22331:1693-1938(-)
MKSFASIAVLGLSQAVMGQNLFEITGGQSVRAESDAKNMMPISQNVYKNQFGCLVEEAVFADQYTEKVIRAPLMPIHLDYE